MEAMGQQVYDLSDLQAATLRTRRNAFLWLVYGGRRVDAGTTWLPYPSGTKGVFYYHLSPGRPPLAGELRFRKCDSIQQFSCGEDLEIGGQPWTLSLFNIIQSSFRKGYLDELLIEPGLVDRELVADLQRLKAKCHLLKSNAITLYDIDQPFIADFSLTAVSVRLITRQSLQSMTMIHPWRMTSRFPMVPSPFHGRARVQFKLAGSPESEERLTLQLRILEILEPIKHIIPQKFVAEPRAGELLMKRKKQTVDFTPWSYSPSLGARNHKALVEFLKSRAADKAKFGV
ncbi:hypothetical protein M413DRAFT_145791 [Hebeloma cylindrosporum]|uniref:Uncharacterized protein n=1 Tax=Hebeloma cylindrosporum TaxID=76867 RepID=A0A0C2YJS8_HEBCY|nr:hypothetical protein M413DRAFT_145791 [Hebeloma cylindrosporum h7]